MAEPSTQSLAPIGYRFSPTNDELLRYYLRNKNRRLPFPREIIRELDLCNYNPWDLPNEFRIGANKEMYFFTKREGKYERITRAGDGFWKGSGRVTQFKDSWRNEIVGYKRSMVFCKGELSNFEKTEWVMEEFGLDDHVEKASAKNGEGDHQHVKTEEVNMKMDSYVLCRVYEKCSANDKEISQD